MNGDEKIEYLTMDIDRSIDLLTKRKKILFQFGNDFGNDIQNALLEGHLSELLIIRGRIGELNALKSNEEPKLKPLLKDRFSDIF
jgi:hypothetical protein